MSKSRKIVWVGSLAAFAFVLMLFDFSVAFFIPEFVKMDFSEVPALIASFAIGPWAGVLVCLIKNLLHLAITTSVGTGELCNFILGAAFSLTAGMVYRKFKGKKGALAACLSGAAVMAAVSLPVNYFITYPFYINVMGFPIDAIVDMFHQLWNNIDSLWKALLYVSTPFNFIFKGLGNAAVTFIIYKHISPLIKRGGVRK